MKIVLDPLFAGAEGMLKVWNATNGAIQVTDEGHILGSYCTAWVTENPTLIELLKSGHAAVVGEASSPKKVSKSKAKQEEPAPTETSKEDSAPVAPVEEPTTKSEESI